MVYEEVLHGKLASVLVVYRRIDAAEMPDEDANNPTDKIVDRTPCNAILDKDNDLLRALAATVPSKILISSRLGDGLCGYASIWSLLTPLW